MKKTIITNNLNQTQALGEEIAKTLKGGEVLCLYGDLGAGKTTFTQGLAKGLGITGRIISPTFIIMRTYEIKRKTQDVRLTYCYHVDLYRIEREQDIIGLGLMDLIGDSESILVIEWAEKMAALLPKKRIDLYFRYLGDDKREIIINHE
jgi:tRNA threonylcarbamoyladenosine biosynthesis protein TsaE